MGALPRHAGGCLTRLPAVPNSSLSPPPPSPLLTQDVVTLSGAHTSGKFEQGVEQTGTHSDVWLPLDPGSPRAFDNSACLLLPLAAAWLGLLPPAALPPGLPA